MNPQRIPPEVLARVEAARLDYPRHHRPAKGTCQAMLRYLIGWSRLSADGRIVDDSIGQMVDGTTFGRSSISRCLDVLEAAGVIETLSRGGSRRRWGSRRRLHLDDVRGATDVSTEEKTGCGDSPHEFAEDPHEFAEDPHEFPPSPRVPSPRVPRRIPTSSHPATVSNGFGVQPGDEWNAEAVAQLGSSAQIPNGIDPLERARILNSPTLQAIKAWRRGEAKTPTNGDEP